MMHLIRKLFDGFVFGELHLGILEMRDGDIRGVQLIGRRAELSSWVPVAPAPQVMAAKEANLKHGFLTELIINSSHLLERKELSITHRCKSAESIIDHY